MYLSLFLATVPSLALALPGTKHGLAKRESTLIPTSCFDSSSSLTEYFDYGYPWGDTHNGAAIMKESQVTVEAGTLTLNATYTGESDYKYDSGTVFAKQQFTVEKSGGLDFSADFLAPVEKGTWPAFWLNGVNSWPPEIDIAEWKGTGDISFNTFNASDEVAAKDVDYPSPSDFHTVLAELRDENGSDVSINFHLDGSLVTTQYAGGLVGQPLNLIIDLQMEGSSGSPGPKGTTLFQIKNLEVVDNSS